MRNEDYLRYKGLFNYLFKSCKVLLGAAPALTFVSLMNGASPNLIADTWVSTVGSMAAARSSACAVALPDGRVLIAGGENAGGALASAEILDVDGRFQPAASMMTAHASPACALLTDGTIMLAGGRTGGGFSNAMEIYDPAANKWNPGSPMLQARAGAALAVLNDGRILLAGGETAAGATESLEIYDPNAGVFLAVPARLSSARTQHAAALLRDGRVLIAGGWDGTKALNTADLFDPASGQVTGTATLRWPRVGLSASTLLDGRVLIAGGSNGQAEIGAAEIFDPQTGQWTVETAAMLAPRRGHAAILVPHNNTVLIASGTASGSEGARALAPAEIYIPWRHEFRAAGSLENPKTDAVAIALAEPGEVAVAGGRNAAGPQRNAETLRVPVILTGKPNYHAGETAQLSGAGWAPGQTVRIEALEAADTGPDAAAVATADETGNWTADWTLPETGGRGVTVYLIATQKFSGAGDRAAIVTAQTAVTSTSASLNISGSCTAAGVTSFAFGASVCATVSGLSAQTSSEQFAWVPASGAVYAVTAAVSAGLAQDMEIPNAGGTWTVKAYPAGSCLGSGPHTMCSGTPDASATFSVLTGKLAFSTAAQALLSNACSAVMSVQLEGSSGAAVAPTLPTTVTLASSNSTGRFFAAPNCTGAVNALTIAGGASAASFYYLDIASAKITAAAYALTAATQAETVTLNPPTLTMAFSPAMVPLNAAATLSITITNPPTNATSIASLGFTDTLPASLSIQTPASVTNSCGGTASATATSLALANANLAPKASCTISVGVKGVATGTVTNSVTIKPNNSGGPVSAGGVVNTATANLTVAAPPAIAQTFGAANISLNGTTTLTFTITNPAANTVALAGVSFSDALPAGLAVASMPGVTGSCGGTVVAAAGAASINLTGGAVPQNGTCTIVVNVTASAPGSLTNSVQVTSTTGGAGNSAAANLQVQAAATHFTISAPASATAGTAFRYTVTALDSSNNLLTTYAGTVHFASSDAQAVLPANSLLTNGSASFNATLKTAGSTAISASDTAVPSIAGASGSIAVSAGAPASIAASGGTPQSAYVNASFAAPLQVTVKDAFGNPVNGAAVSFVTPANGAAAVLSNGTVTTNSAGVAVISATANAGVGSYTVTVTIGSATAAFLLTNMATLAAAPPASSLQLNGAVAGSYSVPNSSPYANLGSFYFDLRISNWSRLSGGCATIVQFVTSAQYGPSQMNLCDPAFGWGLINVGDFIDPTPGGDPIWMQAPNIVITSATATNPMTVTLASTPFPAAMAAGSTIMIVNAAGAGCSGMNANQLITAVSGNTLTLRYDGSACSYTANSAIALSQDFVFRFHRDLSANQLIGEVWNVDGTGYAIKALTILSSAPIALPATLQIGSNGLTANLAYLRWYSGTIPVGAAAPSGSSGGDLADWELDGNGNDSSGHNLNITFGTQPSYIASPAYPPACNAGVSQSFRVGQAATLDGTGAFPLDGGTTLSYSWAQIPSTLSGVPMQNLTWSSTAVAKPTITGLASGPANFQLTVTQGNGQSATCTVHDGAVATDSSGVVINATGNASLDSAINTLIGPQVQLGQNPWPYYDQAAIADAALQAADLDRDYLDYWDSPGPGTVSVTTGSHIVTGMGTAFTTTFCQGPGNPTTPQSSATIIVWYPTGRMVNGVQETGRRRMNVNSCISDTQLNASLPSDGTPWTSDAQPGAGLNYTAEFLNHLWEYGGAPANYYDNVQAYYALYFRSGIDNYLAAARKLADRFWTSPEIDRGMAFNVGDWFGAQNGRANEISGLVLRALDTFDGNPDMWAGLHNVWTYTDWLLTAAYPAWTSGGGIDPREFGYTLAQAAYGALWDTDPTWQAYCRSMIESSFQSSSAGIWPKTLDPVQQGWLQWVATKSTFDSGQAWSGATVTLANGSNVVTCSSGNCGWQASDFAAYDVNTGLACSSGSTSCGPVPVLFTDSAVFPADSSHTDAVSYCYPNACTFIDSNHFTLDGPYAGTSGIHGWVFGVAGGVVGANVSGVVGWGALPYMEGILGWAFDLAGKAMACNATGGPAVCDDTTSATANSYSAKAINWITTYGVMPGYYGISYMAGFPACGTSVDAGNLWCTKTYNNIASRELMGDAYRGLATFYRRTGTPALKTMLDNWFAGMWAKPGTNPLLPSPDGQYDSSFDPSGCSGCGFFLTDGAPYSQKFFGQHFGISNEGGWPAIRLGY